MGKVVTVKSKEDDEFGIKYTCPTDWDDCDYDLDEAASDFDDYLTVDIMGGVSSDGDGLGIAYFGYVTASDVEKGDETSADMTFEHDNDSGDWEFVWKYGNKPNKMFNFLIWAPPGQPSEAPTVCLCYFIDLNGVRNTLPR